MFNFYDPLENLRLFSAYEKKRVHFPAGKNESPEQFSAKLKSKTGTKDLKPFLAARFINTPAAFDLFCYGRRVSFDFGKIIGASGIFPFRYSNIYFELKETGETVRDKADETRLPDKKFCERVYAVREELNSHLKELGCPPFSGLYFAVSNYMYGANWIVGFDSDAELMPADYYDTGKKAKIRYIAEYCP